jgi:hypothetical protein
VAAVTAGEHAQEHQEVRADTTQALGGRETARDGLGMQSLSSAAMVVTAAALAHGPHLAKSNGAARSGREREPW